MKCFLYFIFPWKHINIIVLVVKCKKQNNNKTNKQKNKNNTNTHPNQSSSCFCLWKGLETVLSYLDKQLVSYHSEVFPVSQNEPWWWNYLYIAILKIRLWILFSHSYMLFKCSLLKVKLIFRAMQCMNTLFKFSSISGGVDVC